MSNLPIQFQDKVNSPELLALLQQFGPETYADAQLINKFRDAINELYQALIRGGKSYESLSSAMAVIPLPENNTIFYIDEANLTERGVYAYDSNEVSGYRFVRYYTPNGIVEEGNTQAVSGGEVYESLPKIDYVNDFNLFTSSQVVENALVNISGDVVSAAGWAYAEIPVEYLAGTQEALSVSGQTMSFSNQWVFVDINGVKLSNGSEGSVPTMANLPIPPTAVAFRLTLKRPSDGTGYLNSLMINYGAEPIEKKRFAYKINNDEILSKIVKIDNDYDNLFFKSKTTEQLFTSSQVVENALVNILGDVVSAAGWAYAEIPVEYLAGTQEALSVSGQTMSFSNQWVFVDINGVKLSNGSEGSVPTMANLPIPPTAVAFRLTLKRASDGTGYLNSLMINYGAEPIDFIPYKKVIKSVSDIDILANYMLKDGKVVKIEDVINNSSINNKSISVLKQDSTIYIRTTFNSVNDLVRIISLTGSQNGASNLLNAKLINKGDGLFSEGELIHIQGDSVPTPFQVNVVTSGYLNIGGNHGIQTITDAVSNSHGKTSSDLLSIWKDSNNYEFYLVEILDTNSLRFASKPFDVGGFDKIIPTPQVSLTHVSGAVNTSTINISGSSYEYKPCINSIDVKLYMDDVEIIENGNYVGDVLKVIDNHNVVDPTLPTLTIPYLPQNNGTMVKNTLIHSFFNNGSYTVENITDWQKNHLLTNIGIIQPQVINKGSYDTIMTYAINVNNASGLDFKNGFDLSTTFPNTWVKKADFINQAKSVQQLSEILFSGSNPIIGCGFGYNPLVGTGTQEELLQNENHLLMFGSSKKYYPFAYNLRESQNKIIRGVGYYAYWDATVNPNLSADYFVPFGDSFLYFLNLRTASTKLRVKLSKELLLKEFEVVNSSDGIVLHTENSTTHEGLIVSGAVGDWCILKIR